MVEFLDYPRVKCGLVQEVVLVGRLTRPRVGFRDSGEAAGENVLFMDGHVEWHNLNSGKSWMLAGDISDYIWWTPTFPAPPGAFY